MKDNYPRLWNLHLVTLVLCIMAVYLTQYVSGQQIGNSSGVINTIRIEAGGGNNSILYTQFSPKVVEIKVGDNVTWYNPSKVPLPHTVTFIRSSNFSISGTVFPFTVSNSVQFTPVPPSANAEPVLLPDKNNSDILALNTRATNPVVIDSLGDITYLNANDFYHVDGTEKYVNSGAIFPEGNFLPAYKSIANFTLSFQKPGTYDYGCLFHPWMKGIVIVK